MESLICFAVRSAGLKDYEGGDCYIVIGLIFVQKTHTSQAHIMLLWFLGLYYKSGQEYMEHRFSLPPLSNVVGGNHDRNTLIWVQSISQKHLMLPLRVTLQLKQWYFLCITHTTGGALTGGNSLKVFLDGELVANGKLK